MKPYLHTMPMCVSRARAEPFRQRFKLTSFPRQGFPDQLQWALTGFGSNGEVHPWFRGKLVFKARRLVYHSTPGSRVIKKRRRSAPLTSPNTVELIPTLGALSPRGGPVQDPVLPLTAFRAPLLNTDEFIPHDAGSPFGWIEPEIAQYPKST